MKAILCTGYGPPSVLKLTEVEKPTPAKSQVLVEVHAASINAGDWRGMRANPFLIRMGEGFLKPKDARFGSDVAGRVAAVGEGVTQFRPGDEVFGCVKGSFAEYALGREVYLARKPTNRSFEDAAAVPVAGLTAIQGLRDAGEIRAGQKVVIQGGSGGVGTFAVMLAKAFGAQVTAVVSPRNLEMARSMGADHVVDYTKEDFTKNGQRYDLILAVNGYHPMAAYKRSLNPQGRYICAGGSLSQIFEAIALAPMMSRNSEKSLGMMGIAKVVQSDLITLGELLSAGKITPRIDRTYALSEVPEAIAYVEQKHAQGKVVITVPGNH